MLKRWVLFVACFSISLAFSQVKLTSPLSYKLEGDEGDSFEEMIAVSNEGNEEAIFTIEQRDYTYNEHGQNFFQEPGTLERSNAAWIQIKSKEYRVAPKSSMRVPFKVSIPKKNGELEGSYWSVIFVDPILKPLEMPDEPTEMPSCFIQSKIRFAIQVATPIRNTGTVAMSLSDKEIIKDGDKLYYRCVLENTGTKTISPQVWMEVFTQSGENLGKIDGGGKVAHPGTRVCLKVDITHLDKGSYSGLLVLDQKDADFFGSQIAFDLDNALFERLEQMDTKVVDSASAKKGT